MVVKESQSRYRWVVLGVVFLAQGSNALATQSVAPLAPLFQPELGLTKAEVGVFSSLFFVGAWGVLIIAGSVCDRLGLRAPISLALLMMGLVMLSMSRVETFLQAAGVMLVAGLGGGIVMPGSTKAIMDWFSPAARATAMGLKQSSVPLAGIITASILPVLGLAVGWRSAIYWVGIVIMAGGIVTAILYREAALPVRVARQRESVRAGVRAVLRNRGLWAVSAVSILYVAPQMALVTYLALYLKEIVLVPVVPDEHARVVAAGWYLALCQAGGVFGRVFWGLVSDRLLGGRRLAVLAMVGAASALLSLVVAFLQGGFPLWLLSLVVLAIGATAIGWNGLYHASIAETAGRRNTAAGVGLGMTLNQIGVVGGPPLFGFVVDVTLSYQAAWVLLGGFCAAGAIASVLLAKGEGQVA